MKRNYNGRNRGSDPADYITAGSPATVYTVEVYDGLRTFHTFEAAAAFLQRSQRLTYREIVKAHLINEQEAPRKEQEAAKKERSRGQAIKNKTAGINPLKSQINGLYENF